MSIINYLDAGGRPHHAVLLTSTEAAPMVARAVRLRPGARSTTTHRRAS